MKEILMLVSLSSHDFVIKLYIILTTFLLISYLICVSNVFIYVFSYLYSKNLDLYITQLNFGYFY